MSLQVNVTANGRMVLPAGVRKRLGLNGGGAVFVEETADGVVLRTVTQAVARAQAISRALLEGKPDASVVDFIAVRRQWQ